ncbi:host specificity protein J [Psychrobacter aquimaris]|uniref:host specificity protein J n=1 Tax=Psychrobacter aquimaris TaxID=292733 RepID=UPI003FD441EE
MTVTAIKGAKAGQDKPRKPSIAKDSVASTSTAKILYILGEGEIAGLVDGGKSIYLDGTPLLDDVGNSNFEGVTWDFRYGTNEQEYIKGFPDVSNEMPINVELRSTQPWIKAFTDTQLSAVRIRFKWNRLSKTDPENGDVKGYKIQYAIDLQTNGGAYVEVVNTKIEDKTSAGYERTHRIDLPKSATGWQIRVRRITPNDPSEYVQDDMFVDAVAEVIDVKLRYPNTALLGLQYNAETFSGIAKMEARIRGMIIRVPSNYDPVARTYTGIWDGTFKDAYSNNPAWIYFDLCTQWRYGLGERLDITMIDKWSLYALGQYCDQKVSDGQGGLEPRFTCNVYLQKQVDAYQVLQNIGGIFRAMSYWNGERIVLDADVPQDPVYTFSRANVIDGSFEYTGTRARDRHTLAKVAWDNPLNRFETEYEYIRDEKAMAKFGVKVLDLSAFGCTSQAQAQRAGLWALKTEQLETRQVSFGVGLDGFIPQVGNIINVSDELFAGRANGGRVSAVSDSQYVVTLDRDVVANAGDVLIVNGGGGQSERRTIKSVAGRKITLNAAFTAAETENIWAIETADLKLMRFRVMSITKSDETTFAITAIQHEPQKYDAIDFGTDVKPTDITIINPDVVDAPASVTITSRHRVVQGQTITTLVIGWAQVSGAVAYDVEWRKDDGSWVKVPRTGNVSVEIEGVYSGNYLARVRSVSAFDVQSQPTVSMLTAVQGKIGLPPSIVGLTATGILFGMEIKWSFGAGSGDAAYTEIETGSAPNTNVKLLGQYSYPTNTHTVTGLQGNLAQSYRARLVDKLGFKSEWSNWVTGTTDASADKVLDLLEGKITESQLYQDLGTKIDKIADNETAISKETQDRINAINQSNAAIIAERNARTNAIQQSALEQQQQLQAAADALANDINTVTVAQSETDGQLATVKERQQTLIDENGVQAEQLSYLSSEMDFGYADKTKYVDQSRATVWTFAKTVAHADYTNAESIRALSADYQGSSASFNERINLNITANKAVAQQVTNLSAQMVGGYTGNDVTQITSGLLHQERQATATRFEGLAQQISLISAGVGEQFDPFQIWHFDSSRDGWTSGTYATGWLNVRTETIASPVFSLNGNGYHHVKLRVQRKMSPTWGGVITWSGGSLVIPEPTFDANGIATVDIDVPWSGTITGFSLKLASSADNLNYYAIDWIAVGRPSPGASSAALLREEQTRASQVSALTQANTALDSKLNTQLSQLSAAITENMQTLTTEQQSQAERITSIDSKFSNDISNLSANITDVNNTLTNELGSQAEQISIIVADYKPRYADATRYADASRSTQWTYAKTVARDNYATNERITNLQSDVANSNAQITQSLNTLTTKDAALASDITQLKTATGDNKALIIAESSTRTDQFGSLSNQINTVQSSTATAQTTANNAQTAATNAATLAGNKGEVIYQWQTPAAARQLPQNLWIDTTGGKNTPKRWDGSAWVVVTDKAAIDAQAAASSAQSTANEALGKANTATSNIATIQTELTATTSKTNATASSVQTLQTTVGGHTASIQTSNQVLDGLKAQSMTVLDVDGYVVGTGTYNDGKTGTFAVRADEFYVVPPAGKPNDINGDSPWMVLTTPQVINGVTVAAGAYARNFYAPRASIDTIQIKDAAIKSAQIDALAVDTLHIKGQAVSVTAVTDKTIVGTGANGNPFVPDGATVETEKVYLNSGGNSVFVELTLFGVKFIGTANKRVDIDFLMDGLYYKGYITSSDQSAMTATYTAMCTITSNKLQGFSVEMKTAIGSRIEIAAYAIKAQTLKK